MQKINPGDTVKISSILGEFNGLVMSSSDNDVLVLKLNSGYNIGLEKKKIVKIEVISRQKKHKIKQEKVKYDKNLKTISILHTGGTIASEVDYKTGAVSSKFTPEEIVSMFPELQDIANISSRLISNMFSEDMNFNHYNILAKEVQKEAKKNVDGIIITHGTDTLALTAAALSFALENLNIPVILVGAQRSSDRGSTDAKLNLLSAAHFIAKTDYQDIAICMHESKSDDKALILPPTKTRKFHSSSRDAFKVINDIPVAEVSKEGHVTFLRKHPNKEGKKLKLKLFKSNLKIGILKSHPNMFAKEISNYKNFNALVLEGTGLGHFPVNKIDRYTGENKKILNEIKKLAKKIPVVMTSQTIYGRVNMNVYSTGRLLERAGVIGNYSDMLTETAFIKLAWLLSNYPKDKAKELFNENLRGEISKRTEE